MLSAMWSRAEAAATAKRAMAREYGLLHRAFGEAEAAFDWVKYGTRKRREPGCFHIQPYRGHGTTERLYISGRIFEGRPVPAARADDAYLRNLWHTVQRLGSDEVPAARVRVGTSGASKEVLADVEGFFEASLDTPTNVESGEVWREIEIELIDPPSDRGPVAAQGFAIVPPDEARFGIISDIDDTIVKTDVANLLRMLRLVLLTNAHTRLPFAGVGAFYRALHRGSAGPFTNPLFYVSSSPWNFYDLLTEVFEVHCVPIGPLFLKDYGLARDLLLSRGHVEHKLAAIERILTTHPQLSFVLVGDSGQKDPEIYSEIVRRYPERIEVIYIRDVSQAERDAQVRHLAATIESYGVPLIFASDTLTAAEDAASRGLIDDAGLAEVREEERESRRAPGPIEAVLRS
jgi:phosphatidate phosphatase APP1